VQINKKVKSFIGEGKKMLEHKDAVMLHFYLPVIISPIFFSTVLWSECRAQEKGSFDTRRTWDARAGQSLPLWDRSE
jgi:hypothetical protein